MTKLESVAAEFRKAARAQMSATTQRTLRENVNVTAQVSKFHLLFKIWCQKARPVMHDVQQYFSSIHICVSFEYKQTLRNINFLNQF